VEADAPRSLQNEQAARVASHHADSQQAEMPARTFRA